MKVANYIQLDNGDYQLEVDGNILEYFTIGNKDVSVDKLMNQLANKDFKNDSCLIEFIKKFQINETPVIEIPEVLIEDKLNDISENLSSVDRVLKREYLSNDERVYYSNMAKDLIGQKKALKWVLDNKILFDSL